jgi:dTDP-4-dehydrorhamnose 3,5-epimerase
MAPIAITSMSTYTVPIAITIITTILLHKRRSAILCAISGATIPALAVAVRSLKNATVVDSVVGGRRSSTMTDLVKRLRCGGLLKAIESELRRLRVWAEQCPNAERMDSTLPFSCDKLSLEEWLQFVFIPRLQFLLDSGAPLPSGAGLAPYAEVVYRERLGERAELVALLGEMDRVLSGDASTAGSH